MSSSVHPWKKQVVVMLGQFGKIRYFYCLLPNHRDHHLRWNLLYELPIFSILATDYLPHHHDHQLR